MRACWPIVASVILGCGSAAPPAPRCESRVAIPAWVEGAVKDATPHDGAPTGYAAPAPSMLSFATQKLGEAPFSGSERKKYSGRRIDLDVVNADLHEVCRLLAEVGKINIVVADDVKGAVTIKMKQVPWDQALDAILRAKGYTSDREGNVVTVYAP